MSARSQKTNAPGSAPSRPHTSPRPTVALQRRSLPRRGLHPCHTHVCNLLMSDKACVARSFWTLRGVLGNGAITAASAAQPAPLSLQSTAADDLQPMVLKPLLFQYCFADRKLFLPSQDWQYSELSQARSALKIAIHRLKQSPRGTANAQRKKKLVGQVRCMRVPSQVCCGKVAL